MRLTGVLKIGALLGAMTTVGAWTHLVRHHKRFPQSHLALSTARTADVEYYVQLPSAQRGIILLRANPYFVPIHSDECEALQSVLSVVLSLVTMTTQGIAVPDCYTDVVLFVLANPYLQQQCLKLNVVGRDKIVALAATVLSTSDLQACLQAYGVKAEANRFVTVLKTFGSMS